MSAAAPCRTHLDIKEGKGIFVASATDDGIQLGHLLTRMEFSST